MKNLQAQINKLLLVKQQKHISNWRGSIRWINGYMHSKVAVKLNSSGCHTTVDVPWAKELNAKHGLFKDGKTLKQKLAEDLRNE